MNIEDYTCIKVDRPIERVNRITLNRPDKRNALSDQLRRELFTELTRVDTDDDINLTIIRGNEHCNQFEFKPYLSASTRIWYSNNNNTTTTTTTTTDSIPELYWWC